jgi:hypothetical protein
VFWVARGDEHFAACGEPVVVDGELAREPTAYKSAAGVRAIGVDQTTARATGCMLAPGVDRFTQLSDIRQFATEGTGPARS